MTAVLDNTGEIQLGSYKLDGFGMFVAIRREADAAPIRKRFDSEQSAVSFIVRGR